MEDSDPLIDSIEKLQRLVASSSHFQEMVAQYTEEDAAARIHIAVAGDGRGEVGDVPRPFALIEIEEFNRTRNAGGSESTFDGEGWLKLSFYGELDDPSQAGRSLMHFAAWAYQVLNDICELAGHDDNLNIADAQQDDKPMLVAPEDGNDVPWCWTSWRIQWTRF